MFQIEIPKRGVACIKDGLVLTPGMEYFSALFFDGIGGEYLRRDYCSKCWDELQQQNEHERIASTWKSIVPPKKQESELPKQRDERALYLLREALASEAIKIDRHIQGEAFILALFLARRRKIHFRQELIHEKVVYNLYEVADTEEMLSVPKLKLSDLPVESIQISLAKKFNAK